MNGVKNVMAAMKMTNPEITEIVIWYGNLDVCVTSAGTHNKKYRRSQPGSAAWISTCLRAANRAAGFVSVNSFFRVFKKRVGVTPGAYRNGVPR